MVVERVPLAGPPTPLVSMDRLAAVLGEPAGRLWVKRDDLTTLAGGGNKARKLEYLCADAQRRGATVLVTGGAAQSNHVRMTAAAAAMLGLRCVAVVGGRADAPAEGNVILDRVLGAELVRAVDDYADLDLAAAIDAECARLAEVGEVPYAIPLGGSTPIGALGYADCADELRAEAPPDRLVYVADGTGGTHAGLVAGFGDHGHVRGVDVGAVRGLARTVADLATATAGLRGDPPPSGEPTIVGDHVGDGYARPTAAARAAIELAARTEGLLLDPVYTGKAFGGMLDELRSGRVPDRPLVFVHTGGLPGLFVERYRSWLTEPTGT